MLGDLFEIQSTKSFNVDALTEGNEYDYVTRTSLNQGVLRTTGFVNRENINCAGTWSLGLLQMDFFYRSKPWYAGQFVRKNVPKIEIPEEATPYFTAVLNQKKSQLLQVLVRNVDSAFKKCTVKLPINTEGKIDFDIIKSFVVALKKECLKRVSDYLKSSGLVHYELSLAEEKSVDNFEKIKWEEFVVGTLFEKIETTKLPYQASELPNQPDGLYTLPCLTSSFRNQGLNYFAPRENASILKNVISIPSNSDVYRAYFQSDEFTVLSDAYTIRWKDESRILSESQYLFMVTCINKVTDLSIYSYKNKLGGWEAVKKKKIQLPVLNGKLDYRFMEDLVWTIKKVFIKNVVLYVESELMKESNY